MSKRSYLCIAAALLGAAAVISAAPGETWFARKRLKVKSGPKPGANVVLTLKSGDRVDVKDKSGGRYWLVAANGQTGYAWSRSLSKDSGLDTQAALEKAGEQEARLVALRPDGAIRGLTEDARDFAKEAQVSQKVISDIEYIGTVKLTSEDLEKFLKEGKLGEYGGQ